VKELIRRFREEDADGARAIEAELRPVIQALAVTTNPQGVKAALQLLGWEVGGLRLPLVEATEEERETIRAALDRAGLLAPTPA
jgi:4-hydroxy-tetrahydrodipicolinate synthase